MMKKRILATLTMVSLVFLSLNAVAFAASPQIGDSTDGTVQPQDLNYVYYYFTQTVGERTVEPTSWTVAGYANHGECVTVATMNVPLSFNVSISAECPVLSASFNMTPSSTSIVTGLVSKVNQGYTQMKVSYGFRSLQHYGNVDQYVNGVLYHTYTGQWVEKATYLVLKYN